MSAPQEGTQPQTTFSSPPTTDRAHSLLTRSEKGLYPAHEASATETGEPSLLHQAAEIRGFDLRILQTGGEIYVNGGAPINVPKDYVLAEFVPQANDANAWHLRGEIDALRGERLQQKSEAKFSSRTQA